MSSASVVSGTGLQRGHVVEPAEAGGDVALVERLALERGDEADHVARAPWGAMTTTLQLLGRQPERLGREAAAAGQRRQVGGDGHAEHLAGGDDDERHRVDRHQGARGQHRALHALLAAGAGSARRSEKSPKPAVVAALLAPMGSGPPTWAMTTPISPAGTCTHGCRSTEKIGQSRNRRPGMSSSAW